MEKPKIRVNSKGRIIEAAFDNFVTHGYEGASLNVIAEVVGIRKASIYTHFESKDDLFLQLLSMAFELEAEYVKQCFDLNINEEIPGESYCLTLKQRYEESIPLRFLVRMAYVPPQHLYEFITQRYQAYIQMLTEHIGRSLGSLKLSYEKIELFSDAYLGIIDSLSVELLYGELSYDRRLNAMLFLYRNTLMSNLE